jgi:HlyD family secretion protein
VVEDITVAYEIVSDTQDEPSPKKKPSIELDAAIQDLEAQFVEESPEFDPFGEFHEIEPLPAKTGRFSQWRTLTIGLAIGLGLGLIAMRFISRPTPKAAVQPIATAPSASQTVTVATAQTESVERTMEATGTVVARDLLPLRSQATGLQIIEVLVDEGDDVEEGQVLAYLDDSVLRSRLEQARSEVAAASSTVSQAEAGVEQATSAKQAAESGISQAEAGVSQAESARASAVAGVAQAEAGVMQAETEIQQAEAGVMQAQANVDRAKAKLVQAEREWERYRNLSIEGAIAQQQADFRQTDVLTAKEDVRVALANLEAARTQVDNAKAQKINAQANVTNARAQVEAQAANVLASAANVENARSQVQSQAANILASEATVGNAEAGVQTDLAAVAQLQTQLEQTVIRAPESGLIVKRMARVGDVTSSSGILFEVMRDGELELQVEVPETQLPQVQPGTSVWIKSDADSKINLRGTVREIAPTIDAKTRKALVKVDLPASDRLRAGMFLKAIITTTTSQGTTVPAKAVLPQPDGSKIVYKLGENDTAIAQRVEVGQIIGQSTEDLANMHIEILKGLQSGDRIIVNGAGYVKDGDRVKVKN